MRKFNERSTTQAISTASFPKLQLPRQRVEEVGAAAHTPGRDPSYSTLKPPARQWRMNSL